MHFFILSLLFCCVSLYADPADPNLKSFSTREKKKTEYYDFSADHPHLETIDIDGKLKIRSEMLLTGNLPVLDKVTYEGGLGFFRADVRGHYPQLKNMFFSFKTAQVEIDLRGHFEQACHIKIDNAKGNVTLLLPDNIGITIRTKTQPFQKIIVENPQIKKMKAGLTEKVYLNPLAAQGKTRLYIEIEKEKGDITIR